jgi:hypothetical protein
MNVGRVEALPRRACRRAWEAAPAGLGRGRSELTLACGWRRESRTRSPHGCDRLPVGGVCGKAAAPTRVSRHRAGSHVMLERCLDGVGHQCPTPGSWTRRSGPAATRGRCSPAGPACWRSTRTRAPPNTSPRCGTDLRTRRRRRPGGALPLRAPATSGTSHSHVTRRRPDRRPRRAARPRRQLDAARRGRPRLRVPPGRPARHAHVGRAAPARPTSLRDDQRRRARRLAAPLRRGAPQPPAGARDRRGPRRGADRPPPGRLSEVMQAAYPPGPRRDHPARRTFQALRLVVNDELGALEGGPGRRHRDPRARRQAGGARPTTPSRTASSSTPCATAATSGRCTSGRSRPTEAEIAANPPRAERQAAGRREARPAHVERRPDRRGAAMTLAIARYPPATSSLLLRWPSSARHVATALPRPSATARRQGAGHRRPRHRALRRRQRQRAAGRHHLGTAVPAWCRPPTRRTSRPSRPGCCRPERTRSPRRPWLEVADRMALRRDASKPELRLHRGVLIAIVAVDAAAGGALWGFASQQHGAAGSWPADLVDAELRAGQHRQQPTARCWPTDPSGHDATRRARWPDR